MQHFTRRDMIMLTRITMAKEPVCKPFEKKNTTAENNNEWLGCFWLDDADHLSSVVFFFTPNSLVGVFFQTMNRSSVRG